MPVLPAPGLTSMARFLTLLEECMNESEAVSIYVHGSENDFYGRVIEVGDRLITLQGEKNEDGSRVNIHIAEEAIVAIERTEWVPDESDESDNSDADDGDVSAVERDGYADLSKYVGDIRRNG